MQCIFVDRSKRANKTSDHSNAVTNGVALEVKARMVKIDSGEVPGCRPMLLFPEGTTTNGNFLLPFKTGAFLAGVPLQPVILRYDVHSISPAWESISAARHIFLMLANPIHSVTCYELPVYVPSPEEQANPRLYADHLRQSMVGEVLLIACLSVAVCLLITFFFFVCPASIFATQGYHEDIR